ncbi:DUF1810 domain-containing protein [Microbulbifer thermotolerans]|uniref:DUF1810 domain-containing protein n=1 Tax=Microbulbifer thermotolerans TaxID=252514 RepID=UPI00224AF091|nr:DUF1810 domain-containing protein [Microbulbifer thermotolerans]MCX2842191.1 DUF1810 domain-containing protein [Microbulbifer thermotolerans]
MNDPFNLERFVSAQEKNYNSVLTELAEGKKRSHWMWYVFPQIVGLGHSAMAQHYALKSLDEARAYLDHPLLGPRLRECCTQLLQQERTAQQIFGSPDDLKLRSSMTLFSIAEGGKGLFGQVLDKFYKGQPDFRTLDILCKPQ